MSQDLPERCLELGSGLHPQVLEKTATRALIGVRCLRLPSAPVERKEELALQALAERVLLGKRFDGADVAAMQPHAEAQVEPILERFDAQLVEPEALARNEGGVAEVVENGPTPQCERHIEERERVRMTARDSGAAGLVDEFAKAGQVELVGAEQQRIPGLPAYQQPALGRVRVAIGFNGTAQPMDVYSKRVDHTAGRPIPPENLDKLIVGDNAVRFECERRQERPLFGSPEIKELAAASHLERAEDGEVKSERIQRGMADQRFPLVAGHRNQDVISL